MPPLSTVPNYQLPAISIGKRLVLKDGRVNVPGLAAQHVYHEDRHILE